jgi:hypothetical protein
VSELPPPQIVRFQQIRRQMEEQAFTWDVWGAAYVIEDGCSDDCFRDFRAYLISPGPEAFAAACATRVRHGDDFPADSSDLDGRPRGEPWDDESQDALVQRHAALAARFR